MATNWTLREKETADLRNWLSELKGILPEPSRCAKYLIYIPPRGGWVVSEIKVILSRSEQRTCTTISGRLASSAVPEEELESVSAVHREKKEGWEKTRWEGKRREEIRSCYSTSRKCIYRISRNGELPFGLSVPRVLLSVMFIIPHDGQLDLTRPLRYGGCV